MKVFLDLGTHFAEGLKRFMQILEIDSTWEVHTFEANPRTYSYLNGQQRSANSGLNVTFHNKAVGIEDGTVQMNIETVDEYEDVETGMGSTILSMDEWAPESTLHKYKNQVDVECINFPQWVESRFSKDCEIYCKMDIEGCEFDILEKMINEDKLKNFKVFWVEFHDWAMKDKVAATARKDQIIRSLQEKGIQIYPW
jgi:FkbM family methyltransferase